MDTTWNYRHVAGHQEDVAGAALDRWAVLNIECDVRAKGYWAALQSKLSRGKGGFSKGMWQVRLYGQPVGTNLQKYLRKSIHGGGILSFWVDSQRRISDKAVGMVDWESQGRALRSCRRPRQQWVTKFVSGWCGTGKMMKRWKQRVTAACPRCGHRVEDCTHVLECEAAGAVAEWEIATRKMQEWLQCQDSCPALAALVIRVLTNWKDKSPVQYDSELDFPGMQRLMQSQTQIGWRLFLDGCVALEWAKVQQHYYTWMDSLKSGSKWVEGLIKQLWEVEFSAWEHRNSVLHDTPMAEILSGRLSLDRSLRREWELGFEELPALVQAILPDDIATVLDSTVAEKKGWFVLVRKARENMGDERVVDEFSAPDSSLRTWVGL